jgi:hypothetical protein
MRARDEPDYTGTKPEKTAFVQRETICHAKVNKASQVY